MEKDWIGLLNGTTSSMKFDQFSNMVNAVLDDIALEKVVKISAKHHYVEPWMTRGLEEASKTKHQLYKASLKRDSTNEDTENYRHHRNLYNKLKRKLKMDYYRSRCESFKDNAKKLWSLINNTITKVKHKGSSIPFIMVVV